MRRIFLLLALLLLVFLLAGCASVGFDAAGSELNDPTIPRLTENTGWWIDTTGTINKNYIQQLNQISKEIKNSGFQLGGVFFKNCASDPSQVATKFGNANGIGSAEKDNGIAITVFLEKKGKDGYIPYIFVATGKGLEGTLNDAKVGRFLDDYFYPLRKADKWQHGLLELTQALKRYLQDPNAAEFKEIRNSDKFPVWAIILLVILGILFLIFIIAMFVDTGSSSYSGGGFFSGGGGFGGGGLGGGGGFGGGGSGG